MTGPLVVDRIESPTGSQAQAQFGRMRARLTARYRLRAVPGRTEELVSPATEEGQLTRGVSLGYGCRSIRVRLMAGREWIRTEDFQIKEGWQARLDEMCDTYFGYIGPDSLSRKAPDSGIRKTGFHDDNIMSWKTPPRPIRDNPQA